MTAAELNRALLARQCLLERSTAPLPAALDALCGIQAQYAPSMYVGLWSRLAGFERDALTRALEARTVVQATLMRVTIHLVSRDGFWGPALATREARRTLWLRSRRGAFTDADLARAAETLRGALAGGAVLPMREVEALVGKEESKGVGLWVDLVRAPPSGTWERRRADLVALAEDWVGPCVVADDPVAGLVDDYLRAFGPASRKDVASFTGLPLGVVKPVLASHEEVAGPDGEELYDVPGAPRPPGHTPAPVRFLPTWDATLLVHARRTGVLPERFRPRIFSTRTPHSFPTFLVDGAVAGTWRHADGAITLEPFEPLPATVVRELHAEADRLAAFHG